MEAIEGHALRNRGGRVIFSPMRTHEDIDRRSLELARSIASQIDRDPDRGGLLHARRVCEHWLQVAPLPVIAEWNAIFLRPWAEVRSVLLSDSEDGRRLRQSSPFCSVLSARE